MLRATIRKLKRFVLGIAAYEHHILANRCATQLRLHSNAQLRDIGLGTRDQINTAAHAKCPWCHHHVWQVWITG
jgi:hypothetical protein